VTVPRWHWGQATQVRVAKSALLRQVCSVMLRNHGRRTIYVARGSGTTYLSATVEPASNLAMPAWGGKVVVRDASQAMLRRNAGPAASAAG
jgi:hypothetical protein